MREGINSIAMIKPSKVEGEEMVPQPKGEDKPRLLITFSEGIRGEKYVEARWGKNKPVGIPPGGIPFTSRDDGSSGRKWRLAEVRREEWIGLGKEWRVEVEGGECISKAINEYDETNKWRGVLVGERLDRDKRAMEMLKGMVKPGEGVLWLGAKGEGKEIEEVEGVKVHWVDSPHELALIMENGVDTTREGQKYSLGKREEPGHAIHVHYALRHWLSELFSLEYPVFPWTSWVVICIDGVDHKCKWPCFIGGTFDKARGILVLRSNRHYIPHPTIPDKKKPQQYSFLPAAQCIYPNTLTLTDVHMRFLHSLLKIDNRQISSRVCGMKLMAITSQIGRAHV